MADFHVTELLVGDILSDGRTVESVSANDNRITIGLDDGSEITYRADDEDAQFERVKRITVISPAGFDDSIVRGIG